MPHVLYQGRHRTLDTGRRVARGAALTLGAVVAGVLATTQVASAAPAQGHDWSGVARCESSGNWHINTGNGFYGGLQFTQSTWDAYGGQQFAARADLASESAQITVAERVLDGQGVGAWPVCGQYLTGGTTPGVSTDASTGASSHPSQPTVNSPKPTAGSGGTYTVRAGDTLSAIAAAHRVDGGWRALVQLNRSVIHNPDLIYVGETIRL